AMGNLPTEIAMYVPAPDGGLEFRLRWEVTELEGPYERCGPELGTECSKRVEESRRGVDVDVDQATGNVYVDSEIFVPGRNQIVVYKPDGSAVITRFGEVAAKGKT